MFVWKDENKQKRVRNGPFFKKKKITLSISFQFDWAGVVAQLIECSFPILEVLGSNPVIGKNLHWALTVNCIEYTKIKKKGREWPIFFKKSLQFDYPEAQSQAKEILFHPNDSKMDRKEQKITIFLLRYSMFLLSHPFITCSLLTKIEPCLIWWKLSLKRFLQALIFVTAIPRWIRLRLPIYVPGFIPRAQHLSFFNYIVEILYQSCNWIVNRTKINKKEVVIESKSEQKEGWIDTYNKKIQIVDERGWWMVRRHLWLLDLDERWKKKPFLSKLFIHSYDGYLRTGIGRCDGKMSFFELGQPRSLLLFIFSLF